MLFSTTQLSRVHHLEEHSIHLHGNGVELKQTNNTLLLGTVKAWFHGRFFSSKCETFRLFLLNCEQSSRNNLFEWSQFKWHRRNNSHFAKKKRSRNQALMQQNLKWNDDVNRKISECYAILSVLRKLKYLAPYNIRKHLAESLVLSKLDYNDVVCSPVPDYLLKRL
jgi:hypothetical protein